MGFDYETGDDFDSGSKFLEQPGEYHMVVEAMEEKPRKQDGELIANAWYAAKLKVLAGSSPGQEDKEHRVVFFKPNPDSKDGGDFARKKSDRFLLAVGLITPEDRGKKVSLDLQHAVMRQLLIKLDGRKDDRGRNQLDISFANIFHVDDPEAASYPRDGAAIALIPQELRRIGGKPAKAQEPKVNAAPKADFSSI